MRYACVAGSMFEIAATGNDCAPISAFGEEVPDRPIVSPPTGGTGSVCGVVGTGAGVATGVATGGAGVEVAPGWSGAITMYCAATHPVSPAPVRTCCQRV